MKKTTSHSLLELHPSSNNAIIVSPRWPYSSVWVSQPTLNKLIDCNQQLEKYAIQLAITRGFEDPVIGSRYNIRRTLRITGALLFLIMYFPRRKSRGCLFGPNGHDIPDTCIDLSVIHGGKIINLLPFGVFTPLWLLQARSKKYADVLTHVRSQLIGQGFALHSDPIEAAQIHCNTKIA
jgi:hypothetical protein